MVILKNRKFKIITDLMRKVSIFNIKEWIKEWERIYKEQRRKIKYSFMKKILDKIHALIPILIGLFLVSILVSSIGLVLNSLKVPYSNQISIGLPIFLALCMFIVDFREWLKKRRLKKDEKK